MLPSLVYSEQARAECMRAGIGCCVCTLIAVQVKSWCCSNGPIEGLGGSSSRKAYTALNCFNALLSCTVREKHKKNVLVDDGYYLYNLLGDLSCLALPCLALHLARECVEDAVAEDFFFSWRENLLESNLIGYLRGCTSLSRSPEIQQLQLNTILLSLELS